MNDLLKANDLFQWIDNLLFSAGIAVSNVPYLRILLLLVSLTIVSILLYYITKHIIIRAIYKFFKRTRYKWDDIIVKHRSLDNFAHLIPAFIVKAVLPLIFISFENIVPYLYKITDVYIIVVFMTIVLSFLKVIELSLSKSSVFTNKPIASYFQLLRIVIYIVIAILVISLLINKSPAYLLSAFGALSAILLLIFKDTILGLVASVQISSNDMVQVGDWVEIPKFGVDGDVIAINLNTVKIKNWDNTMTMVPTYYFITDSFKNWRNMQQSGARRIKRAIYININSIKFIDDSLKARLENYDLIRNFLNERQIEIDAYNEKHSVNTQELINGRRMTNIGVFRRYIEFYLKNHPHLRKDMTLMVRQLEPTDKGLPLEIYCFSEVTKWIDYEGIIS
ncbi:MAG: mechanosensitive ion channel, partial [Bacteroidales bacterium]|nr:mechanosensitive ion channel [Bacteroidales bacterium]